MARTSFDYFRENTLLMIIIFGLAIAAFVIGDPLMQMARGPEQGFSNSGDVAVSWEGGQLTEGELSSLVMRRQQLMDFLGRVEQLGLRKSFEAGEVQPSQRAMPLRLPTRPEEGVERDVVAYRLYANAAQEAGLMVSDDTIREYLAAIGYDRVSPEEMRKMLGGRERGVNIRYLFDLLRETLLARNFLRSYLYASQTTLPEQRWRDWLRVQDEVVVEAAAFRAEDFLDQVPEPTDDELQEFFDEYKEVVPTPDFVDRVELPRPTPGFATPRRVTLQYARLPMELEVDRVIDSITDEEIEKDYEDFKDLYIDRGLSDNTDPTATGEGDLEEAPAEEGDTEDGDTESSGTETEETESEGEPEGAAPEQPGDESTEEPTTDQPSADDAAVEEAPTDEPSTEEPATEPAADATDTPAEPRDEQSSRLDGRGPFRFARFQDDAEADETASTDGEETVDVEDASGEEATDATVDDGESAEGPDAGDEADDTGGSDEGSADSDSGSDSEGGDAPSDDGADEEPEVKYLPLEEVKEEIRLKLAERKARSQLTDRMAEVIKPLKDAYTEWDLATINAADDEAKPEPPAELKDIKSFAEKAGLDLGDIQDAALLTLRDSEIGRTYDLVSSDGRTGRPLQLWERVFGDTGLDLHRPIAAFEASFDRRGQPTPFAGFLVIKLVDTPRVTPALEDVRADVTLAWKMQKAAELALEKAKKIAEEAEGKGLSLRDYLAGRELVSVVETSPFSWVTAGRFASASQRPTLRLSQPEEIANPGPEFMETVFELDANKLGAVLNHDHSVAYVVRVVQHESSRAELRQSFLLVGEMDHMRFGLGGRHAQAVNDALLTDLFGLKEGEPMLDWKRPADTPRGGGDS